MPFTFAHPAIVLPFYRVRWLSFSALIFGSMAPDFEYFLRLRPYSTISHTVAGLFLFDLPMVFLLAFLFHFIVKRSLVAHLPAPLDRGLHSLANRPWQLGSFRSFVVFAYSALIGSFSHVAWDAFTHDGAFFVQRISLLQQKVVMAGWEIPVYKLLQHGSTLGGLLLIALFTWAAARRKNSSRLPTDTCEASAILTGYAGSSPHFFPEKLLYWSGVGFCGILTAAGYLWLTQDGNLLLRPLAGVVPFLSGCILGLVLLSLLDQRHWLRKRQAEDKHL
ncbi:DUF4184 family protein [Brevibacillus ruminantium]|uniref:DUF4184 family protein n=1 Tax=Brevibacillus ruminantium TaxID=2950604 RepID=A0ABY4WMQ0_9BACL|nr:DUF4184 family protein [Brevibacillus ruminantium]USG68041.1 DUF4184 family protein [Brevibacillus ruminantium]